MPDKLTQTWRSPDLLCDKS